MKRAQPKTGKKVTLEDLAEAIQADFVGLKSDMSEGFARLRAELASKKEVRELRADVKMITDVMATRADLAHAREELAREIKEGKHIDELRARVGLLEKHLGISRAVVEE